MVQTPIYGWAKEAKAIWPEQSEGQRLETLVGNPRLIALEQTTLLKGGFDCGENF
ncbi:hypothetical protein OYT88_13225 [Sporolactobacillus sp. CQH2019]|uniref:hypothetical protein n=1 Tax=Sporolactobacillus sp. CQH2019 TaxID=3023512 RepID=UPI002368CCCC|nr:hypothetical protein [Sporolactobacillus sp. CQH2019]MDD9149507.1 hypothetical protein [Sporolactobacillus sp. CQH2019]